MKRLLLFAPILLAFSFAVPASALDKTKCEASINGYKIKTVYITGSQFNGVAWAYKHISQATCLTPVEDMASSDAILEVLPKFSAASSSPSSDGALVVNCNSNGSSSSCVDSDGNELDVSCDGRGNCTSYYGPSVGSAIWGAFDNWITNAWFTSEVRLYTPDHKLIWKSDGQKGRHWYDYWPDKLREATTAAICNDSVNGSAEKFRKYASEKCNVEFAPLVSIDIKANARLAAKRGAKDAKQAEAADMKKNAAEAAAKQAQ